MAYHGGPSLGSRRNAQREPSLADLVDNIRFNLEYAGMSPPLPPDRFRDPRFRPVPRAHYRDGPCRDMPERGMAMFCRESQPFDAPRGMRPRILSRGSREYMDAANAFSQHTANRSDSPDTFPVRMSDEVSPLPSEVGFPQCHNVRDSFHSGRSGPRSRSTSFNCQPEGSGLQSRSTSFSSHSSARPFVQEDDLIARELATACCHYGRGGSGSVTPSVASEDTFDFVDTNFEEYDPENEAWNIVNPG